MKVCTYRYLGM